MELLCAGELLLRVASSLGSRNTTKAGDSISVSLTYLSVEVKVCSAHSQYRSSHVFSFFFSQLGLPLVLPLVDLQARRARCREFFKHEAVRVSYASEGQGR